jgi:D-3-phosphoglycerate dehydrogenase
MKILHLEYDQYPKHSIEKLNTLADVFPCRIENEEELVNILKNNQYDAIFTRLGVYFGEHLMILQTNLKYIVTSTTGLNHIDIEAAQKRGIQVISLKGEAKFLSSIKSTAEHTWAILLCLIRNIIPANEDVIKNGHWNRVPFLADELDGKTIGIIGFGRLGKIVATYAKAFGMNVLVTDKKDIEESIDYEVVGLLKLLNNSDFICLMIDYSTENKKFMNRHHFKEMKKDAYFINTSRGELIDQSALLESLENGHIKGAAIDVIDGDSSWSNEFCGDIRLLEYAKRKNNLIITPHMGGYGKDSIYKTREFVVNKYINLLINQI